MKKNITAFTFGILLVLFSINYAFGPLFLADFEDLTVAACPSYHHKLTPLRNEGFNTVRAGSTGEAIAMVSEGSADFAIGGRNLKPDEPADLNYINISPGLSFIAGKEFTLSERDMSGVPFFTDLEPEKIASAFLQIEIDQLTHVEDVYSHLNEGVVITSFEGADYSRAEVVHVINDYGRRVDGTRVPTIFFFEENSREARAIFNILN